MKTAGVLILVFVTTNLFAQQVKSKAYQVTLKALLSHTVPEISVEKAKKMKTTVFLDARELAEFEVSHLKNAQWVGYDTFDLTNVKNIDKSQLIVVYCSVGYRSEKVAEKLTQAGYTQVSNLYGGIFEWVNQGNTVVDTKNQVTPRVHAYDTVWGVWLTRGNKVYSKN